MSRQDQAAGIAGLCFLAVGLVVAVTLAMQAWDQYTPAVREWLFANASLGMAAATFAGWALVVAVVEWRWRR